ncbi:hypothetical protein J4G52_25220 [Burkholderia cenocepacia]|uniref:hypothetical protein n=1 Tax=Burkholderia cenocepacia TaxID=95486 RepID=UPI001AA1419A|nr:hypothetical protein [Burkholderia cenocepacia]MBO1856844.1 hypothetical protein [Burkholderia cenocepacia]
MATKKIPVLRIVPMTGRPSYRAIGRVFTQKATDIAIADLSKEQIAKLKADPWLSVTETQVDTVVPDETADATSAAAGGTPPAGGAQKQ